MTECTVSLAGTAVSEVSRHTTSNGRTLARFRMIVPERRFDKVSERYVDRDPSYFTVRGHVAENVLATIRRGHAIVVSGHLRVREWRTGEGVARTTTEVTASAIGIDLAVRGKRSETQGEEPVELASVSRTTDAA